LPEAEVVLLAHLIGGGRMVRRQSIRYASGDEANLCAVGEAAKHFGVSAVRDEHADAGVRTLRLPTPDRFPPDSRNPVAAWLDELGVLGRRSHERFLPDRVFSLPRDQIVLFLRHLWATDGSVRWDDKAGQARLHYPTTSRRLADDLARLLLRIGVFAQIKPISTTGHRDAHHVLISGAENQLVFLDQAGCHGGKSIKAAAVAARLRTIVGSTHLDTVPQQVWERVRALLAGRSMTHRDHSGRMNTQFRGSTAGKHAPSRTRLARAAAVLDDAELEMLATNDVFWDDIAEITSLGEQPVFDATVPGTHNFVANCIAMHNSLEQDADMVLLVHRPDAWERDDPRAGEADLILAKHRAGPTTTITVAHQLHYSRFVDLAQG
jgi:replicative DNA helicase